MTHPQAEALYHLASHHYHISEHGERLINRKWKTDALHRLLSLENEKRRTASFEKNEARFQ